MTLPCLHWCSIRPYPEARHRSVPLFAQISIILHLLLVDSLLPTGWLWPTFEPMGSHRFKDAGLKFRPVAVPRDYFCLILQNAGVAYQWALSPMGSENDHTGHPCGGRSTTPVIYEWVCDCYNDCLEPILKDFNAAWAFAQLSTSFCGGSVKTRLRNHKLLWLACNWPDILP
jgi:hypothetical protein